MAEIGGYQFKWPRKGPVDDILYVLAGRIAELPKKRSKIVRIFLSSTFTDTYEERNAFMHDSLPRLKEICKDKYDLDFQLVDMRWGVRDEASDDHSASDLCMRELRSCQKLSVGPTFVTLVGQRYGSRPLPLRIPQPELELITSALRESECAGIIPLVEKWYRLDENSVPPEYVLQSLTSIGKSGLDATGLAALSQEHPGQEQYRRALLDLGREQWKVEEPQIAEALRCGALICIDSGQFSTEEAHVFTRSVTDEEIEFGLLKDEKRDSRCLCFIRTLQNINLKHAKAWRFIDQTDAGEVNHTAQHLLQELKAEKIPAVLAEKNIFRYEIPWSDDEGVNSADHKDYLHQFCETIEREIIRLVEQGLASVHQVKGNALYEEVLEHAHQAAGKCERFHGRTDVLSDIRRYIFSKNDEPFVIYGESGCGKTSIMAKAALMIPDWFNGDPDTNIILRFLGTTPSSSTISGALTSVITQIHQTIHHTTRPPDIPTSFIDICDMFLSVVEDMRTRTTQTLVLILDSLDQLSPVHKAHELGWFPVKLPPNVKLIFSTLPEEHDILERLREMKFAEANYLAINPLSRDDSRGILEMWLQQQGRRITAEQEKLVDAAIENEIRPLYLKLIFDELLAWRSYEPVSELATLQPDIESSIRQLFERLESKHGSVLVQRAFGYLTASRNGLTELEMEDLLSLDDTVLDTVFEYHLPPIRRLPSILWARVRADIAEYVVDREADGATVMAWYHRQFIEKAERYFDSADSVYHSGSGSGEPDVAVNLSNQLEIARNMYDYFAGKWSNGVKKPFKYTDRQIKKYQFKCEAGEADRYVSPQPPIFRKLDGSIDLSDVRFNRRKISEFPQALDNFTKVGNSLLDTPTGPLRKTGREAEKEAKGMLREAFEVMLFDYQHLLTWSACTSWADMSEFLEENEDSDFPDLMKETQIIRNMFLLCVSILHSTPHSLALQISGRMLPYYGTLPHLTNLIDTIENEGRSVCALLAPHYNLEMPGGALLYVVNNHTQPITAARLYGQAGLISISNKLVMNSMETGVIITDTKPKTVPDGDHFAYLAITVDGNTSDYTPKILACTSLKFKPWIYVIQPDDGFVRHEIHLDAMEKNYKIDGIKTMDKFLVVFSNHSANVYLYNALEGTPIDSFRGEEGSSVEGVHFMILHEKMYLAITRCTGLTLQLHFYYSGPGTVLDDSSDGIGIPELKLDSEELNWHASKPVIVDLNNTAKLSSFSVPEAGTLMVFAFDDGSITYLADSNNESGGYEVVSDVSDHDSAEASDLDDPLQGEKQTRTKDDAKNAGRIQIDELDAVMRTVSVDYFPLHALTCVRTSVHEEMLLLVGCSENMMAMYELMHGETVLRVRKRYDGAVVSYAGKFLYAYAEGTIDVFTLYFDEKITLTLYASIDAHSRPIIMVGIMDFDIMAYSAGQDGALKFWNMQKLAETQTPKLERAIAKIKHIVGCCGPNPDDTVALTTYESPNDHVIEVWDCMTGKRMETIYSKRRLETISHHLSSHGNYEILAFTASGELLAWDISDLVIEETPERPKSRSNKRIPRRAVLFTDEEKRNMSGCYFITTSTEHINVINSTGLVAVVTSDTLSLVGTYEMGITSIVDVITSKDNEIFVTSDQIRQYQKLTFTNHKLSTASANILRFNDQLTGLRCESHTIVIDGNTVAIKSRSTGKTLMSTTVASPEEENKPLLALSSDGEYVVKVVNKDIELLRVQDGRLLAKVTLYDTPLAIDITGNGWFVLFGMPDKRLMVLMISDPQNPEHTGRARIAHACNQSLQEERSKELADFMTKQYDSSEDEEDPTETLRLARSNFIDMNVTERRGGYRKKASIMPRGMSRMSTRMTGADSDGEKEEDPTHTIEGEILTNKLCTVQ